MLGMLRIDWQPWSRSPGVKEIPAPAFRVDQHIRRSLTMGVAIKPCIAEGNLQQCARAETMKVGDACRDAFLVVVRGRGLRHQSGDISELRADGKTLMSALNRC